MQIIDLDEVAQTVAPMLARYKADSEKPGGEGVLARLGTDCDLAMTLWRCKESNRGTDGNDIIDALLTALAAHVVGEVMQHVPDPDARTITALNIGRAFIQKVLTGCNTVASGVCHSEFVHSKEVGTA